MRRWSPASSVPTSGEAGRYTAEIAHAAPDEEAGLVEKLRTRDLPSPVAQTDGL
jgi:hypothetical protein